jgi:hypothetical protein
MEGPAGGDHLTLRDVVKDDFSTGLLLVVKDSARSSRTTYAHGVKSRFFIFGRKGV